MGFTWIIGHVLAVAIGISLGLIGGGGSILAVPILVYVMGLGTKEAIASSLVIVGSVSVIGVIPHWQKGNVKLKTAITFIPPAMLGAFVGAKIAGLPLVTDTFQLICFSIIMLLASIFMIRKGSKQTDQSVKPKFLQHQYQLLAIAVEGFGVGILTGFVGIGGGFLIIPALVLVAGIPMKQAVGTSLVIIAFNSVAGLLGYLNQVTLDWALIGSFTLAASGGIIGGAYLTQFIDAKYLQKGFGYFVLAIAVFMLIKR
jgi:uncharacterized membrane protein YfcA